MQMLPVTKIALILALAAGLSISTRCEPAFDLPSELAQTQNADPLFDVPILSATNTGVPPSPAWLWQRLQTDEAKIHEAFIRQHFVTSKLGIRVHDLELQLERLKRTVDGAPVDCDL